MSRKHNWPEYGIGFVVVDDDILPFTEAMGYKDPYAMKDNWDGSECEYYTYNDYDMDGLSFYPFAEGVDPVEPTDGMLCIKAKEQPDPFRAAYPCGLNEMITEFRNQFGKKLPDDFDWKAHIGKFSCSVYC